MKGPDDYEHDPGEDTEDPAFDPAEYWDQRSIGLDLPEEN